MYKVNINNNKRIKRKLRVRKKVFGTKERPRLSVFRSNRYIYACVIDDTVGKTLVDTFGQTFSLHEKKTKSAAATEVGKLIAEVSVKKNIKNVVFDKNGYRYHGRVKNLADGAREGGLNF